jgi:cell division protein FtsB
MDKINMRTLMLCALLALILLALLGWRSGCQAADRARQEASIASATGTQLDKVTAQTADTRQGEQEKKREVDKIPGADAPLPDNFGRDLERVRKRPAQPRNP